MASNGLFFCTFIIVTIARLLCLSGTSPRKGTQGAGTPKKSQWSRTGPLNFIFKYIFFNFFFYLINQVLFTHVSYIYLPNNNIFWLHSIIIHIFSFKFIYEYYLLLFILFIFGYDNFFFFNENVNWTHLSPVDEAPARRNAIHALLKRVVLNGKLGEDENSNFKTDLLLSHHRQRPGNHALHDGCYAPKNSIAVYVPIYFNCFSIAVGRRLRGTGYVFVLN